MLGNRILILATWCGPGENLKSRFREPFRYFIFIICTKWPLPRPLEQNPETWGGGNVFKMLLAP